jgi:hypothetical protein
MEIPYIYVHDGTLIRVIEEPKHARITMRVGLPMLERDEQLELRFLVFTGVCRYQVVEGWFEGYPALLDLSIIGREGGGMRVRLDTNRGYREIDCSSVNVHEHDTVA